ncbi:MAG: VanZ family protein [Trueperaceae bacterium]
MPRGLARGSLLWRLAPVAWMLLVFLLSSQSGISDPFDLPGWLPADKLAHAGLFGVLSALLYMAGLRPTLAVAVAALYGVVDEVHQMFVPGRNPDILDWLADIAGAAVGVWLVYYPSREARSAGESVE